MVDAGDEGKGNNIYIYLALFGTIFIHFYDATSGFARSGVWLLPVILLNLGIGFGIFILFRDALDNKTGRGFLFGAIIANIALPIILGWLPGKVNSLPNIVEYLGYFILFVPVWPIFVGYLGSKKSDKIRLLSIIYVLLGVFFVFGSMLSTMDNLTGNGLVKPNMANPYEIAIKFYTDFLSLGPKASDFAVKVGSDLKKAKERLEAQATGEYYTGEIDENAEKNLGVFLKDVQAADSELFIDQPVTVWGTLEVDSINEEINISVNCLVDDDNLPGVKIYPNPDYTLYNHESVSLECHYEPGILSKYDNEIKMQVTFGFKTKAYIKTYFMDEVTKRAMLREGIDPLDHYGITDKEPEAIRTSGPVDIGLNIGKPPLGTERDVNLRITLSNYWDGEIANVTNMYLVSPNEFELMNKENDKDNGDVKYICRGKENYQFDLVLCDAIEDKGCDDSLHTVYKMDTTNYQIHDVDNFEVMLCRYKVTDSRSLLGTENIPITTEYFEIVAEYDYTIEEEVNVDIKGNDERDVAVRTVFTSKDECDTECTDIDGCLCPEGCVLEKGAKIDESQNCNEAKTDENEDGRPSGLLIKINDGAQDTDSRNVKLKLTAKDYTECSISNDDEPSDFKQKEGTSWEEDWILSNEEGLRRVWFYCKNGELEAQPIYASIEYKSPQFDPDLIESI